MRENYTRYTGSGQILPDGSDGQHVVSMRTGAGTATGASVGAVIRWEEIPRNRAKVLGGEGLLGPIAASKTIKSFLLDVPDRYWPQDLLRMRDLCGTQNVILPGPETLRQAVKLVSACESCSPEAGLPFDYVLDELTGNDPTRTDYMLAPAGARCPHCHHGLTEKTLVEIA